MKKIQLIITVILFATIGYSLNAQVLSESAKRKVTVGVDVFTDIWMKSPDGVNLRTIHQGATGFAMYNFQLAESISYLSIGLGIRNHNIYSDSRIEDVDGDTIKMIPIPANVNYKRSKINLVYLDLPIEFKMRFNSGFKLGIGFKGGWLIDSKEKYVGDKTSVGPKVKEKYKDISHLETYTYGATLRLGYKSFNLYAYYQFSEFFKKGLGPELQPLSVGLTITPF